jgi:hypothetical protein
MFVRRKQNSSGSTSIQVIDKSKGKYTVVTTIGSSKNPSELDSLELQGKAIHIIIFTTRANCIL